ncbi:MAG: hypothetical protein GY931_14770 [Maribacter sp.]|nr:hypothetical protein [Maribacter sp.]
MNTYNPRATQQDFIITRSMLVLIAVAVLGFFASVTSDEGLKFGLFKISPIVTMGEIISVEDIGKYKGVSYVDYVFSDKLNNTEIKGRYVQNKSLDKDIYKVGGELEIVFFKYFPQQNYIKSKTNYLRPSFRIFLICFIGIFILCLFLAWNTYKYFKFKNESKRY